MAGPLARRLRAQSGFTLVETLVAAALLAVVLTAVLSLFELSAKQAAGDQERAHAIREAQVGLTGLVRQGRQAYKIHANTAQRLEFSVLLRGEDRRVVYDCAVEHPTRPDTRRCVRFQVLGDGGQTSPEVVIDRVLNTDVFAYTPDSGSPTYVTVNIEAPAAGERDGGFAHKIVLNDGFAVRNAGVAP
jgi:prepilin-type N-terminal cleavage/methylation domain-containing protein